MLSQTVVVATLSRMVRRSKPSGTTSLSSASMTKAAAQSIVSGILSDPEARERLPEENSRLAYQSCCIPLNLHWLYLFPRAFPNRGSMSPGLDRFLIQCAWNSSQCMTFQLLISVLYAHAMILTAAVQLTAHSRLAACLSARNCNALTFPSVKPILTAVSRIESPSRKRQVRTSR